MFRPLALTAVSMLLAIGTSARAAIGPPVVTLQATGMLTPALGRSRMSDLEAVGAVRDALARHCSSKGRPALPDARDLSRGLVKSVALAADADSVRDRSVPSDRRAQYFFYAVPDPTSLPPLVASMAEGARSAGVAATFRRTPSHPDGTYWVALALR